MSDIKASRPRRAATAILLVLAFAALMLPSFVNGFPILFPDSVGYYRSGTAALDVVGLPPPDMRGDQPSLAAGPVASDIDRGRDGVSAERSVYYGILVVLVDRLFGPVGVPVTQALLTLIMLFLALRHFGMSPLAIAASVGAISLLTGLAIFSSTIMPDLYAGLMICAAGIVIGFWRSMDWRERCFWLSAIGYAMLAHKGHIAVLSLLLAVTGIVLLFKRRFNRQVFASLAAVIVIAYAGHAAIGIVVKNVTGKGPITAPFLLARAIGDGTVKPYLDEHCATERLALCAYSHQLPMTETEVLWSRQPGRSIYGTADLRERERLNAEAGRIVAAAIRERPIAQFGATISNIVRVAITVGATRYTQPIAAKPESVPGWTCLLRAYPRSAIQQNQGAMHIISRWMLGVYLISLLILASIGLRRRTGEILMPDARIAAFVIVVGVGANAAVFGALSSVVDRYQGRVAWLVPFVLLALYHRRLSVILTAARK